MENVVQSIWLKSKPMIKAGMIGIIVLVLLIPTFYVQDLVAERQKRQEEAVAEITSKWAGKQKLAGPVLVLPYKNPEDSLVKNLRHFAYFLPDDLKVNSTLLPEEKHRGIYKVMLYTSAHRMTGSYSQVDTEKLGIAGKDILWNEAFLQLNIADIRGMNDEVHLNWKGQARELSSPQPVEGSTEAMLRSRLNLTGPDDLRNAQFTVDMNLSGSQEMLFLPLARTTTINLSGQWPHPSFTGDLLPLTTTIRKDSFAAQWKTVSQQRNLPQQWKDRDLIIADSSKGLGSPMTASTSGSDFGVSVYVPVNEYQKTMRSVKYAVLCILLTFAAFFLIETTHAKSVHPFQYGLIGLALVLFYTLLLSFSEYIDFNISYLIASASTIGLIAWFVKGILQSARLGMLLSLVLLLIYTYMFTILQLQDYSLLLGSVGLFIMLAVIMHFSKKIQW